MAGVADFVAKVAKDLGIPAGAAQAGTGALLDLVRSKAGPDLFGKLTKVLPDAATLAKPPAAAPAAAASSGGGGVLGGLAQKAGSLLGGGGASGVAALLAKVGISADKVPAFAGAFVNFLKSKLPADLFASILAKAGDLGKLVGA